MIPDLDMSGSDAAIQARLQQLEARSRDATDNTLTFERSSTELSTVVRKVTKLEDKEIDAIHLSVHQRAARGEIPSIACRKGCWHCCAQMVAATIPEILRIADQIRETWSGEERAALDLRMKGYMEATLAYREGLTRAKPRHVCPLLEDNACSVWTVRPIVCRGVNSTDVEACIRKREDPINDPPIPQIVGQFYAAMYSRTGMRYGLKKHGLDSELVELIPALMIALQDPSAGDRYLSGEPIFAGAKVTGREV